MDGEMRNGGNPKQALVAGRTGPRIVIGGNALLQLLLLAAALALAAMPVSAGAPSQIASMLRLLATASIVFSLAVLSLIDARTRTLPRTIVRPLYSGGLAYMLLTAQVVFPGDVHAIALQAFSSLFVGAVAAAMLVGLSAVLGRCGRFASRHEADGASEPPVGAGDIRLVLALGLMLRDGLLPVMVIGCAAACAYALSFRRPSFPFGPFLAAPAMALLISSALVGLP